MQAIVRAALTVALVVATSSIAFSASVTVTDADTLVLDGVIYRLQGIVAPETDQICLRADGAVWSCGIEARDKVRDFLGTGAVLYVTWPTATLLGYALGTVVADPKRWGFDFAFTAVFVTLAVGLARKHRAPLVWIASAVCAFLADRFLAGSLLGSSAPVLVGGIAGALVAAARPGARDAR